MYKMFLALAAMAALFVAGCTVDCEICGEEGGMKFCQTAKEVKRGDCKDCSAESIAQMSEDASNSIEKMTKADVEELEEDGISFSCEKE